MATVRYGGAEFSYPDGAGLADAIDRYANEHAGDAAALGGGSITWSVKGDFVPLVFPATVWFPDGESYDGTVTVDDRGGITFTPVSKDGNHPPPPP